MAAFAKRIQIRAGNLRENISKLTFDFSALEAMKFPSRHFHAGIYPIEGTLKRNREMVKIRLRREGTKDRPYYRIIVADGRARREGAFIEQLGTYDPLVDKADNFSIDLEKADAWIAKGAQPSETVRSMIKKARQASA
jgi:small subunit ribosomal protein S16